MKKLTEKEILELLKGLNSFEDACKVRGMDPDKVIPDFAFFPEEDRPSMKAHARIVIMIAAANQLVNGGVPWKADFTDDQAKYEALFEMRGSAGFRFFGYGDWFSASGVGSRLSWISPVVARIVCERFADLWNEWLI